MELYKTQSSLVNCLLKPNVQRPHNDKFNTKLEYGLLQEDLQILSCSTNTSSTKYFEVDYNQKFDLESTGKRTNNSMQPPRGG